MSIDEKLETLNDLIMELRAEISFIESFESEEEKQLVL